jgi:CheY-like chemotaxis protein
LTSFPDLQVAAEADEARTALEIVARLKSSDGGLDLVVVGLQSRSSSIELCQQIQTQYPDLPLLLLTSPLTASELSAAQAIGIGGYSVKGSPIVEIVRAIRQVATGSGYWQQLLLLPASNTWRDRLRRSGLQQIDRTLAEVGYELENYQMSTLDRWVWGGRKRELAAARWLVRHLLPAREGGESLEERARGREGERRIREAERAGELLTQTFDRSSSSLTTRRDWDSILESTRTQLHFSLDNLTKTPLEIDILREEKKRELLIPILGQVSKLLDELRSSEVQPEQLAQKLPAILQDLWEASTIEFFGKYYTVVVGDREYELVNVLLADAVIVYREILAKIPLVEELFSHFLFQTQLAIDNHTYDFGTPEAIQRSEVLLQNLIIQVGNGVIQPLLNHFADLEIIKQNFYHRRLISTREIAKFRNDLSWKYRLEKYVGEAEAIFESKYYLFVLSDLGIKKISIYAPRNQELERLTGIPFVVSLALEIRDAIAPRLKTTVFFAGKAIVYILTQVIGRGLGLIGRGILQGIGSAWQETGFKKNSFTSTENKRQS